MAMQRKKHFEDEMSLVEKTSSPEIEPQTPTTSDCLYNQLLHSNGVVSDEYYLIGLRVRFCVVSLLLPNHFFSSTYLIYRQKKHRT